MGCENDDVSDDCDKSVEDDHGSTLVETVRNVGEEDDGEESEGVDGTVERAMGISLSCCRRRSKKEKEKVMLTQS
jgi:hypothetical protein